MDVIDHEADNKSQTIILGTGRSLLPMVVNQGSTTNISVNVVNVAAEVDLPDEHPQRVKKWFSTKSQASATEIVWKCPGSLGANAIGTLMRADASDESQNELNKNLFESRAESDSCLFSTSRGEASIIRWDERLFSNVDVLTLRRMAPMDLTFRSL